jgi:hypothetical protein
VEYQNDKERGTVYQLPPIHDPHAQAALCGSASDARKPASKNFRRQLVHIAILTGLFAVLVVVAPAQSVPNNFFGLHMHSGVVARQPWPVVSFGSIRLWDAAVSWSDLNKSNGAYNWTTLDKWLAAAQAHNDDLLYTFGRVPQWASSSPYESGCSGGPGTCAPPNDLNADGTGTDQHFKDFVTALATHNKNSTTAHIKYWELWNEPFNSPNWVGTTQQMVRMAGDATAIIKSIDPSAVVIVPSVCIEGLQGRNWLDAYLAAGGKTYADAVAFHGYVQKPGTPLLAENILAYISKTQAILAKYGLQNKPLWDTELSWGKSAVSSPAFTDPDMRMGFLARMHLLHRSAGVARLFWYQWNSPSDLGTLWVPNPTNPLAPGTVLKPGIAYGQIEQWMAGANMTSACSANGTVWSCNFTRPNGYVARAVWDTAQSCANGTCTTSSYPVGTQFVQYRTLSGATVAITGSTVPIGYKPILLEN